MLHEAIPAVGKTLFLLALSIKENEVAGDVLHLCLDLLLHTFPRSSAYTVEHRWHTLFAFVF